MKEEHAVLLNRLAGDAGRWPAAELPPGLIALAETAGVLHLVMDRVENGSALGAEYTRFLAAAAMGALRLQEFGELSLALATAGIQVAPLKGLAYGLLFERGGPRRPMADIDLLVEAQRYEAAIEVLRGLGYHDEYHSAAARAPGYHERAMLRAGRMVEIHRAFLPGRRLQVDYAGLWARTRTLESEGIAWRRLSPEDLLLHHCLHMGVHEFAVGGLRAVCELRQLIRADGADLEIVARRAQEWGVRRMLWCAFRLLEVCFPADVPAGALERLAPAAPVRLALERLVVRPSIALLFEPRKLARSVQILRKALLLDRPAASLGYLTWWLRHGLE